MKNKIESNFGMVGLTLNSKQLVLPIESYLMLAALSEKKPDQVLEKLNKFVKKEFQDKKRIEKRAFKELFCVLIVAVTQWSTFVETCRTGH